jgi:ABC-2 type transport system ATP-binding protein
MGSAVLAPELTASVERVAVEPAVETIGLHKSYGDVEALRGIDLDVERGSVFGLLGPNGAGKTTAVRILTTLLRPDDGSARVAGFDVVRDAGRVRERIGLAGQYAAVDENLTGFENLEMVGRLYHLGRRHSRERARELLSSFDLTEAGGRLVRTYSGGMRRRLDLAAALVARPPVLFLDEPTTGLDIRSRIDLWDAIEALVSAGTTVLLTTQYLDEADRLADRIAVIDQGSVIAEGTPGELKGQVGGERLEIHLCDDGRGEEAVAALASIASDRPFVEDGSVRVPVAERRGTIANAVRRLDDAGIAIDDISVSTPTLDDVFLNLTGHAAEPEAEESVEVVTASPTRLSWPSAACSVSRASRTCSSASRSSRSYSFCSSSTSSVVRSRRRGTTTSTS